MAPSRSDLAKIHIAKKELRLTEEVYRDILRTFTGRESAAAITPGQAWKVLDHFKTLGWRPKTQQKLPGMGGGNKPFGRKNGNYIHVPQSVPYASFKRKILVIWKELWPDNVEGINTRCKQQFGVDQFVWIRDFQQLHTLAKDLNKRLRNQGKNPEAL